ncbi:MAG: class I SAM-dependent methyltransferase [Lewinellaceae bacterium]|jgi:SAM-dependent methyltransferase|nr:class I SAM-dependent methyltransferase [Lewinellaceae bacterium]
MKKQTLRFISRPTPFLQEKERLYLEVRRREGRLLSDKDLQQLPDVDASNPNNREWRWRRRSFGRFLACCRRLSAGREQFRLLDLGCGNGWMANRLAENPAWEVWATDLNVPELEQGARLFERPNLHFVYADVMQGDMPGQYFDVIVLAASVQYFSDFAALIETLLKLLKTGGEIHILDSPFYKNEVERDAARQRTAAYYSRVGVPEMADYYHHHIHQDAKTAGAVDLNGHWGAVVLQKTKWLPPFPWYRIRGA